MTAVCPSARARWVVSGSALALLLVGCPDNTGPVCTVISVAVLPGQISVNVTETTDVTASVNASNCSTAPSVTWSSSNPTAVSVQGNGNQAQVTGLVPTTAAVTVSATAGTVSGSVQVTVLPRPAIALNPASLTYTASEGGANPASQVVTITNSGGGTLSGLTIGTIAYGAGATGWLQAPTLSGTTANPSVTLTVQPVTGGLGAGTHTATIPVVSGVAANSPQGVTVSFTVTPQPPAIALNPASLTYSAAEGGANPPSQVVTISNSGGGMLSGLTIGTIAYGAGATGWLQAPTLSGTTANPSVTLTVQPVTGGLGAGTHTATIPVQSGVATNSPRNVAVTFTVGNPCLFASARPIAVGATLNGTLTTSSCLLAGGRLADLYVLTLDNTTNVIIDQSASFDTYLYLADFVSGTIIEEDDDDGPGLNSHIGRTLAAGQYIIQASSYSSGVTGAYTLAVQQAALGPPATIAVNTGNAQKAAPTTSVAIAPSAIVRDANGFQVGGVTVTFATLPTVGSVTGATAVTGPDGIATVGSWTLAAGPNVLSATASGLSIPAVFSATGTSSSAGYGVDLRFLTMPTLGQFQSFASAVTRWQTIITNDLADIANVVLPENACAANSPAINEDMDDLVIQVTLEPIDGPGAVLGAAGPCFIRNAGSLPLLGLMRFDVEDLVSLENDGQLNPVILHEMAHVIGIGTLWQDFNLLANPSLPSNPGADTRYTGVNGIAGFDSIGGTTYTGGAKVPVENSQGGAGTRDAHWRESVLANELLTGFLDAGSNPLSLLTVLSLRDFGYAVNMAAADSFFLVLPVAPEGGGPRPGRRLLDDVRRGPIYRVGPLGRITDLHGRPVMVVPGKE